MAEFSPHRPRIDAVRGASRGMAAALLCTVVYRTTGVRLLQLLSALSCGRRHALGLARPSGVRRGLSPLDGFTQRGISGVLYRLSSFPDSQPVPQYGAQ